MHVPSVMNIENLSTVNFVGKTTVTKLSYRLGQFLISPISVVSVTDDGRLGSVVDDFYLLLTRRSVA